MHSVMDSDSQTTKDLIMTTKKSAAQLAAEQDGFISFRNPTSRERRFTLLFASQTGGPNEPHEYVVGPGECVEVPRSLAYAVATMDCNGIVVRGLAPTLIPDLPNYRGVHPALASPIESDEAPEPTLPGAA